MPDSCRQLLVGKASDWDANRGTLQLYQRTGKKWLPLPGEIPVLFGSKGLAWGIGVAGQEQVGPSKREGDKRAPAGLFRLGRVYTDFTKLPPGADFPFHTVTPADAWIDDPSNPNYNRHLSVDLNNPPTWFAREQMKQNDPAHRWKVEIRHNSDPPIAGAGSAIFFHIRRGINRPSAGCTTMAEEDILRIIQWLRESDGPHYVLLTEADYQRLRKSWRLP